MAVFELFKARRLQGAGHWPITEGWVEQIREGHDDNRRPKVTLYYSYKVSDERFGGHESFVFAKDDKLAPSIRFSKGQ